jgi:tripartite-type tricarboxylate transporter receptor subunit TctC
MKHAARRLFAVTISRRLLAISIGVSTAVATFGVSAQSTYPVKPVRVTVGYAPGGLPDTVARVIAQKLTEQWGQTVFVDNRVGANGSIAAEFVQNTNPDGYSLLVTDNSTHAINPFLYTKLSYDPAKLAPVTLVARAPLYLAVHSSVPATTFGELVALLKSSPGKYSYGSSGIGSTHHLCMEFLKSALGVEMSHIPYKGTGQSVPAVVSGQVPMVWSAYPSLAAHANAGKIRLLAVNSAQRSTSAPNLPTVAETVPGFDFAPTIGFFASGGTPKTLVARISSEINRATRSSDVTAKLAGLDIQTVGTSPEDYAKFLKADEARYSNAVKISGAKVD